MREQTLETATLEEHIFVDGSNLYIEGQRVSQYRALAEIARPQRVQDCPCDLTYRVDFAHLFAYLEPSTTAPHLVGSRSDNSASMFEAARFAGFTTTVLDRNASNREKAVDMTLAMLVIERIWLKNPKLVRVILVAGDRDYVPLVEFLQRRGIEIEVHFWGHASHELKQAASRFISLDNYFDYFRWSSIALRRSQIQS